MYTLVLSGKITPKARPRFAFGHAYMPTKYKVWKAGAIASLTQQWAGRDTLSTARIIITLGSKGQRGDLDNICGSVLDALVQAGVLEDDRLSCVPEIAIKHLPHESGQNLIMLN